MRGARIAESCRETRTGEQTRKSRYCLEGRYCLEAVSRPANRDTAWKAAIGSVETLVANTEVFFLLLGMGSNPEIIFFSFLAGYQKMVDVENLDDYG